MLRKTLVVLFSILFALALVEGILRVLYRDLLPNPGLYVHDPWMGQRLQADWAGEEFGTRIEINSQGLRNPEVSHTRSPGTYRIVALGDSWTFGYRVEEVESFPRQLERILNDEGPSHAPRYELINAGVPGYSTEQEEAWWRVEGYRYEPDLLLVAYYPVNDTSTKMNRYRRHQAIYAIHPRLLDVYRFPQQLYVRQFYKGARRALKLRLAHLRVALGKRLGYEDPPARAFAAGDWTRPYSPNRPEWQDTRQALLDLGRSAREREIPVLLILLPDLEDLALYLDAYHARVEPLVRGAAEQAGMDFLDLRPTFEPYRDRVDEVRLTGQRHPNAAGFGVIARAVADEIQRRYPPIAQDGTDGSVISSSANAPR